MTDEVVSTANSDITQNGNAVPAENAETVNSEQPKVVPAPEKTLTQTEVDKLVWATKVSAYEKGKNETLRDNVKNNIEPDIQAKQEVVPQSSSNDVAGEVKRQLEQVEAARYANEKVGKFVNKLNIAKQQYPDAENNLFGLGIGQEGNIVGGALVELTDDMDDAIPVLYDLSKNHREYVDIVTLMQNGRTAAAKEALQKISASLKMNTNAANNVSKATPLDEVKPNTIGAGAGSQSVKDMMDDPFYQS